MKTVFTDILLMQQDYFWFLASLGLAIALFVSRGGRSPWLTPVLAGNFAMAILELVQLARPLPAMGEGAPNLLIDLLHGCLLGGQAWVLLRSPAHRGQQTLVGLAVAALVASRLTHPWSATAILCSLVALGVLWRPRERRDPTDRRLARIVAVAVWFSPIGSATSLFNSYVVNLWSASTVANAPGGSGITAWSIGLRRWSLTGAWGVWAALVLAAVAAAVLLALHRRERGERERIEWRRFATLAALWLAAGLALAALLGRRTRLAYEDSQKMRANLAAKLIDPASLEAAFRTRFDPRLQANFSNPSARRATVDPEFQGAVLPVRRQLATIQSVLPADAFAFVTLERNGWNTIAAASADLPSRPDVVVVLGPAAEEPRPPRKTTFVPPYQEVYGLVTQARAPLYYPDGTFVGWLVLEFGPEEWIAGQTQVRLQALVIVGLGFGLALMGLRQRLKNLARDEALRAAEVARQADRTKTEFLARVSHELRTPIQSVLGYGELLQSAVQGEAARARLGALRQHGLLMLRLVNDLLDLGALQTGRFHLSPKPTRLFELVQQTVESMRPRAEAKGLSFHTVIAGAGEEWRLADGERIRQVVLNLVANAIKFTDSGSIQVTFALHGDEEVVLKVSDTGPGIPADGEGLIFQPFARLESTAAKEGTGLGLVLAKALCESMGGGIALEPQARGACFVARFRLAIVAAPQEAENSPTRSLRGRRILIVDDNTLIRELFSSYFQELGAACAAAPDGATALQLAGAQAFDAVVLDLALPGMAGTEVARQLRLRLAADVRIVGVSAHASAEDREQALAAGMDAFLTKPVDLRTLVQEIDSPRMRETARSPQLAGLTERLRAQFRVEAPVLGAALTAAIADGDWPAVRAKAHYLKNSADVLGLKGLADSCHELELAAERGHARQAESAANSCHAQLQAWT
jgi:signal transduction histidine kinase/DNA-binding NarL/FixJ family response regulator